jgi:hypothetical protein
MLHHTLLRTARAAAGPLGDAAGVAALFLMLIATLALPGGAALP